MSFLAEYSEVPIGSNTDYVRQWCRFRYQPEFLHQIYFDYCSKKALKIDLDMLRFEALD